MTLFENLRELLQLPLTRTEKSLCMVVSEQLGAEIWIGGKKTNYHTPKLVVVPKGKDVLVEVKQVGFQNHRVWVRSIHNLSFHYCDLKRIPLHIVGKQPNSIKNILASNLISD